MLPAYILDHHLPPPSPTPTLTLTAQGRLYPSKILLTTLGLRVGQPIDLLPPGADCTGWHLDLRPTARLHISWHAATRPRINGVRLPAGLLAPGTKLTLALGAAQPHCPGLYQLTVPATSSENC
ncbi:hypothetical protein E4631_06130 [Hymenobacter sp. UV11]|uniref:hypothetical protein n=1 Tax=Hymenobacter sp. UV11 TaxID=1849735 RepID=UPI00105CC8E9|nr:hypothetical protein [Hymenobacter sp. UV11]TDN38268.1 hypothetical protein A8B98_25005 [Hymenobacter sp. UV11]TFZ67555.1 hypothetical protein E4631_06130 [Hymenobacter sp. UV11]